MDSDLNRGRKLQGADNRAVYGLLGQIKCLFNEEACHEERFFI